MGADHLLDDFFDHLRCEFFEAFFDDDADAVEKFGVIACLIPALMTRQT